MQLQDYNVKKKKSAHDIENEYEMYRYNCTDTMKQNRHIYSIKKTRIQMLASFKLICISTHVIEEARHHGTGQLPQWQ